MAINNKGQVVYTRDVDGQLQAWVSVGFTWHGILPVTCQNGTPCDPGKDPTRWQALSPVEAQLTRLSGGGGHEALGINNAGKIVGTGFDDPDLPCLNRAVFWEDDTVMEPFDLHSDPGILPDPLPLAQESRAEAINNRDPLQVVGENLETGEALLWERDAGVWTVSNLQSESDVSAGWLLVDAHDINDQGCIVGWGFLPDEQQLLREHVYLLCEGCVTDCGNLDCVVGTSDLLTLLAQWGQIGASCDMGLSSPGVGTAELLEVLANWGSCCAQGFSSPPDDVQTCLDRYCCDPEDFLALETCLCYVDPEACE